MKKSRVEGQEILQIWSSYLAQEKAGKKEYNWVRERAGEEKGPQGSRDTKSSEEREE